MTTEEYNQMMNSDRCQRTIHLTNNWGKCGTRKCGKIATHKQADGLPICMKHFNKLKLYDKTGITFINKKQ
jgi:hypothetical protein